MKTTKRRVPLIPLYDHTTMEKRLERMAESGWMLEKITNYYWQYRRVEPKKLHFTVTYYPNASAFDPAPSEGEQTFQAYCAEAGWQVAATSAKLQVFYNDQEHPVPIETDSTLQVQTIHKSMKVSYLLPCFALIGINLFYLFPLFSTWKRNPMEFLASTAYLVLLFNAILISLFCLNEIIGYYFWYHKAKKSAERDGTFVETHSLYRLSQVFLGLALINTMQLTFFSRIHGLMMFALIWFCLFIGLCFVVNTVKNWLKRKWATADTNRFVSIFLAFILSTAMTIGLSYFGLHTTNHHWFEREPVKTYDYRGRTMNVYHDTLPLTIEDLEDVDYPDYSYESNVKQTVFLTRSSYSQKAKLNDRGIPNLQYSTTVFKMPSLYDLCLRTILKQSEENLRTLDWAPHYRQVNASLWGANKAYQNYYNENSSLHYLLCYPDRLVTITFDEAPTAAQMVVIGEKLSG